MFCHKCGSKSLDGAAFCQKCGAKLIKDEAETQSSIEPVTVTASVPTETATLLAEPISAATQESVTSKTIVPALESTAEVCDLLKEGLSHCPKIKCVSPAPKGNAIRMKGRVYDYIVSIVNGQVRLGRGIAMPFTIPLGIITGFLAWVVSSIAWDFMEYGFNDDYIIPLAIGLLAIGLFLAILSFLGEKETRVVLPYICETLAPRPILMLTNEQKKGSYIITFASCLVVCLIGLGIMVFVIVDNLDFGGNDYVSASDYNYTESSDDDSVSLSQTYASETEGFAFNYPDTWGPYDGGEGTILAISDTGGSTVNARMSISKYEPDDIMTVSKEEYREHFSKLFDGYSILEFSDTSLNGISLRKVTASCLDMSDTVVGTQYIYIVNDNMYVINFSSLQSNYSIYEPIFNAIMDSYTITAANTSGGTVLSGSDMFGNVLNEYIGYINDATYTNCTYALYDIDGNGVDELLVRYDDMMDQFTKIYTYTNNTTYEIGEFWSRNSLQLDEDGNFYIIVDSGAANTTFQLARISSNGTDLVTTEAWEMDGYILTHSSQNGVNVISEREFEIATDRFYNITTDFVDSLDWQPLSAAAGEDVKELSVEELRLLNEFINTDKNYGFLLSEYAAPGEIDLNQVLYNGTGEMGKPLTDQETEAYLKASGMEEIFTDIRKLTTQEINTYLMKKLGITMEEITGPFDWTYVEEFDSWYFMAGDTNFTTFTVTSGRQVSKDLLELECTEDYEWMPDCRVTLRKTGDEYQFVSNVFIE